MGLLDELRREADLAKEAREAESVRQAALEKIYRVELIPRLLNIHRYLSEMIGHLEMAGWIIESAYDIPGAGRIEDMRQGEYRLHIDQPVTPKKVTLQFICAMKDEGKFILSPSGAEDFRLFLNERQVYFGELPVRGERGQITQVVFYAKLRIAAGLTFEADIPNSRIRVITYNVEGLGQREYFFGYTAIEDAWLDDLGHFLLRKKPILGGHPLSDEARERLRQLAAKHEPRHEQRLGEIAVKDEKKDGLFGAFRNRFLK